jgi:hypothetical protein
MKDYLSHPRGIGSQVWVSDTTGSAFVELAELVRCSGRRVTVKYLEGDRAGEVARVNRRRCYWKVK